MALHSWVRPVTESSEAGSRAFGLTAETRPKWLAELLCYTLFAVGQQLVVDGCRLCVSHKVLNGSLCCSELNNLVFVDVKASRYSVTVSAFCRLTQRRPA